MSNADLSECLNCRYALGGHYCANCGQKTTPTRLDFDWLIEEIFDVASHIAPHRIIRTIGSMLFMPGTLIVNYIAGKRVDYQQPLTFLAIGYGTYFLSVKYLFTNEQWITGTLQDDKLNILLGLLLIAIIVHISASRPKYNFIEAVVAISYIYGTAFILAPLIVLFQLPFAQPISHVPSTLRPLVVDIPLSLLCLYMSTSFCRAAGISLWRLIVPFLFAFMLGAFHSKSLWSQ